MTKYLFLLLLIPSIFSCKNPNENKMSENTSAGSDSTGLKISLAQWSFHKTLQSGEMDHLQFAEKAGALGFTGVEYVNQFFKDKAQDTAYLNLMTAKSNTAGVKQLLIMIDGEGHLGDPDETKRNEAVLNHHKWVDAAAYLGCHSIRVNAHGEGKAEDVAKAAIDGLSKLSDYASAKNINVIVENHGGFSSNGQWLADVMAKVNKPNCGTLPDFGNFCLRSEKDAKGDNKCVEEYDRYKGVEELMPYAKAVSAKSFDFGELGFETTIDYPKMMDIVQKANYRGFIGVEYEGTVLSEEEGIKATKVLIENCIKELSAKSE